MYINLTGDVEFMVENRLYPIEPGSVVVVRPHELHHCIYRKKEAVHKHFCLYFTSQGNEKILRRFFARESGEENLIPISRQLLPELQKACFALLNEKESLIIQYQLFFEILALLEKGEKENRQTVEIQLPEDVREALKYIDGNLAEPLTVRSIAEAAHVSVNTLERHFLQAIQLSPGEFLKQRRMHRARKLLRQGASVAQASADSGFSDCSHFISLFKKQYGMTPFQFKKAGEKR